MKLHKESHLDHGLTARQLARILFLFEGRDSFFIETIELPEDLGTVPCGLFGPIMGDDRIDDIRISMQSRGERPYKSRLILSAPRPTRKLTVIAGSHEDVCTTCDGKLGDGPGLVIGCDHCGGSGKLTHACILYTAFGGPQTPQEPGELRRMIAQLEDARSRGAAPEDADDKLAALARKLEVSDAFWRDHALSQ